MFRKKDNDIVSPSGESALRRSGEGLGKAVTPAESVRRKVDLSGNSSASTLATTPPPVEPTTNTLTSSREPEPDRHAGKRLIVGEGIRLSGEISSCDRLVVEGEVEVTLNDTLALEIAATGHFTGGCEVEEADISGTYEGDLTVRQRLIVRGSGKLTGTVRYGQLELERGGQIAGNISVLEGEEIAKRRPSAEDGRKAAPDVRSEAAAVGGGGL